MKIHAYQAEYRWSGLPVHDTRTGSKLLLCSIALMVTAIFVIDELANSKSLFKLLIDHKIQAEYVMPAVIESLGGVADARVDGVGGRKVALDMIPRKFGKGVLTVASAKVSENWRMKRDLLSPCCTTRWDELLKVG